MVAQVREDVRSLLVQHVYAATIERLQDDIDDVRSLAAQILMLGASVGPDGATGAGGVGVLSTPTVEAVWLSLISSDWLASCSEHLLPLFARLVDHVDASRLVALARTGRAAQRGQQHPASAPGRPIAALRTCLEVLSPYCFHVSVEVRRSALMAVNALVRTQLVAAVGGPVHGSAAATGTQAPAQPEAAALLADMLRFSAQQAVVEGDTRAKAEATSVLTYLVSTEVAAPVAVHEACSPWFAQLLEMVTVPQTEGEVLDASQFVGAACPHPTGTVEWDVAAAAASAFVSVQSTTGLRRQVAHVAALLWCAWDARSRDVSHAAGGGVESARYESRVTRAFCDFACTGVPDSTSDKCCAAIDTACLARHQGVMCSSPSLAASVSCHRRLGTSEYVALDRARRRGMTLITCTFAVQSCFHRPLKRPCAWRREMLYRRQRCMSRKSLLSSAG